MLRARSTYMSEASWATACAAVWFHHGNDCRCLYDLSKYQIESRSPDSHWLVVVCDGGGRTRFIRSRAACHNLLAEVSIQEANMRPLLRQAHRQPFPGRDSRITYERPHPWHNRDLP
jgi:hypothetical protein